MHSDPFEKERRNEQLRQELERMPTRLSWVRSRIGSVLTLTTLMLSFLGFLGMLLYIVFGSALADPIERQVVKNLCIALFTVGLFCFFLVGYTLPYKGPKEIASIKKQWAEQDGKDDLRWDTRGASAGALTEARDATREGQLSVNDAAGALSQDERETLS